MAEALDVYGILHQNFVDAGCSEKGITVCLDFLIYRLNKEFL